MNILAFDTSAESCSVALHTPGGYLVRDNHVPRQQAERLLPMIDELFKEADLSYGALDGLALTRGPGAFTGLRIAVSAAQALAWAWDLPTVTVSTLAVLAQGAHRCLGASQVVAVLDARMQEVYWGAYRLNTRGQMISYVPDQLSTPNLVHISDELSAQWMGVGSGFLAYPDTLPQLSHHGLRVPEAIDIIELAQPDFLSGEVLNPDEILPVYLRNKVVTVL